MKAVLLGRCAGQGRGGGWGEVQAPVRPRRPGSGGHCPQGQASAGRDRGCSGIWGGFCLTEHLS